MSGSNTQADTSNDGVIDFKQDVFGTLEGYADNLTKLLLPDNITGGGRVLNVDGGWGTGKTFFIERWANKLRKEGYAVVTFNAWENDSAEDPLGPLLASVHEQLKEHLQVVPEAFKKVKVAAGKIALSFTKSIGHAVLEKTLGNAGSNELQKGIMSGISGTIDDVAGEYIDTQIDKLKQQKALRTSLQELADSIETQEKCKTPIWIFVDELDRCRPSFAVELLERVKHCFDLKGFRFVFATNTGELVHSIKVVYGREFNAYIYLQRFFEHTFVLPSPQGDEFAMMLLGNIDSASEDNKGMKYELLEEKEYDFSNNHPFASFTKCLQLSLRQQEQAFRYLRVCLEQLMILADESKKIHIVLLSYLACAFVHDPRVYMSNLSMRDYFVEKRFEDMVSAEKFKLLRRYESALYYSEEHIGTMLHEFSLAEFDSIISANQDVRIRYLRQYEWIRKHLEVFRFAGDALSRSVDG